MHDQCSSCVPLDVNHLFVSDRVKSLDCGAPAVDWVSCSVSHLGIFDPSTAFSCGLCHSADRLHGRSLRWLLGLGSSARSAQVAVSGKDYGSPRLGCVVTLLDRAAGKLSGVAETSISSVFAVSLSLPSPCHGDSDGRSDCFVLQQRVPAVKSRNTTLNFSLLNVQSVTLLGLWLKVEQET